MPARTRRVFPPGRRRGILPGYLTRKELRNATLGDALAEAREGYAHRRPKRLARHLEAAEVMPGGNTRNVLFGPFPFTALRGEGSRIEDADGIAYVNLAGEYTAGLFGHSHPAIRAAVLRALDGGVNLTAHNAFEARFARLICDRFPSVEQLRFTNSGTEANLMALACATIATGRRTILAFEGGYHGSLLTSPRAGGSAVNVPHRIVLAPYNDLDAARSVTLAQGGDLAAIIVEPMLGSGGCIPAEQGFLEGLRTLADETGAVLIFDEVMTSRLSPGGLQQATRVLPDLTTLGKYVGGGMSFGAFGGRAELMVIFDPRRSDAVPHAGTFNNNTLTMSAGIAALGEIYTPDVAVAHNARGDALRQDLNAIAGRLRVPVQATARGSMMSFHVAAAAPRNAAEAAAANQDAKELLFLDLLEHGFYVARRGMIALSLVVGDDELGSFRDALEEMLSSRAALLRAAAG